MLMNTPNSLSAFISITHLYLQEDQRYTANELINNNPNLIELFWQTLADPAATSQKDPVVSKCSPDLVSYLFCHSNDLYLQESSYPLLIPAIRNIFPACWLLDVILSDDPVDNIRVMKYLEDNQAPPVQYYFVYRATTRLLKAVSSSYAFLSACHDSPMTMQLLFRKLPIENRTALLKNATLWGLAEILRFFVPRLSDRERQRLFNKEDQDYHLLHLALEKKQPAVLSALLEHTSSEERMTLLAPDIKGWTPLHWASFKGEELIVSSFLHFLLHTGSDHESSILLAGDKRDQTPFHLAAKKSHVEVVRTFSEFLTQKDSKELTMALWVADKHGNTPLHLAAMTESPNREATLNILLSVANPSDITFCNRYDNTFLKVLFNHNADEACRISHALATSSSTALSVRIAVLDGYVNAEYYDEAYELLETVWAYDDFFLEVVSYEAILSFVQQEKWELLPSRLPEDAIATMALLDQLFWLPFLSPSFIQTLITQTKDQWLEIQDHEIEFKNGTATIGEAIQTATSLADAISRLLRTGDAEEQQRAIDSQSLVWEILEQIAIIDCAFAAFHLPDFFAALLPFCSPEQIAVTIPHLPIPLLTTFLKSLEPVQWIGYLTAATAQQKETLVADRLLPWPSSTSCYMAEWQAAKEGWERKKEPFSQLSAHDFAAIQKNLLEPHHPNQQAIVKVANAFKSRECSLALDNQLTTLLQELTTIRHSVISDIEEWLKAHPTTTEESMTPILDAILFTPMADPVLLPGPGNYYIDRTTLSLLTKGPTDNSFINPFTMLPFHLLE